VASDFVRQISSPFTTRLALVLASWADENIIRIETVQDAFVAFSQRIFFLFDFEKTSQQLLKVPKAPRSAFRYVWGIHGNIAVTAPTGGFLWQGGSDDPREIFPSMYKRNLQEGKCIENIFEQRRTGRGPIPTSNSMAGVRLASRLTTASRRTERGLDTSLTPGPFLRHVGNVEVWLSARPQSPRPRPGPPRSRSTPTRGVLSGSGV